MDFGLKDAISYELVKMIVIDKRKGLISELENEPLDFKVVREGNTVISLSKGQKL